MKKVLAALLFCLLFASSASADTTCSTTTLTGLVGLGSAGCNFMGIQFNNFSFSATGTGGAAVPSTDSITVNFIWSEANPTPEIVFTSTAWNAAAGQTLQLLFSFSATTLNGSLFQGNYFSLGALPVSGGQTSGGSAVCLGGSFSQADGWCDQHTVYALVGGQNLGEGKVFPSPWVG